MDRINVTKTFLPPIEEYESYLKGIWQKGQLTNQGPLVTEFEGKIKDYLGVDYFHFVSNGTIALQLSLNGLGITDGEVITTPFSYVATTSSILWERCTPIFVDIEPETYGIDVSKIEAAITPRTKAIMAVHVFGFPCDVEAIANIAEKHNLKVIYDAAHAFGVEYAGRSLLSYGDISTCSFHATKLFHTIEGGCVVAKSKADSDKIELIKRFGHNGDDHYVLGINAKASEFQAAMGLVNMKHLDNIISRRKELTEQYDQLLSNTLRPPRNNADTKYNYAYYPILLDSEESLLRVIEALNDENIFPRRYFYPSLNLLPYVPSNIECPVSEDISRRIMCLPLYHDLSSDAVRRICSLVMRAK